MGSLPPNPNAERLSRDLSRLKYLDEMEASIGEVGGNMLASMMTQVRAGRPLTETQRDWVERTIERHS